jgi:hypothetical protein
MVEDDLNNVKFHLSLFWKLESFANLDGADAVESNTRLFEVSKTNKLYVYLTDATSHLFHGQQINEGWK